MHARPPVLIAACLTAAIAPPALAQAPAPPPPTAGETLEGAARAPFEDLNLIREKIPPVLLQAEAAAYAPPVPADCGRIEALVVELDAVLGGDFDALAIDGGRAATRDKARRAGAELAREAASSVVPFRGWVRRLSGAQRHAEAVRRAVAAGRVRRGYLKGLGQAKGCQPPAAPHSPLPAAAGLGEAEPSPPAAT